MRLSSFLIRSAIAASVLLGLAGCAYYPAGPYYGGYGPAYGPADQVVIAPMAPPPLIVESPLVAPYPGHIWIGGYWSWSGSRHVWTPGRWEAPRPGYRWTPRRWDHGSRGWQQHGGHWERH